MPASEKTVLIVLNADTLIFTFLPESSLIVEYSGYLFVKVRTLFVKEKPLFRAAFTTLQKSVDYGRLISVLVNIFRCAR
jgi:hypothetical protein